MSAYKYKVSAKSGKCQYFRTRYKKLYEIRTQDHFKKIYDKCEVQEAEFLIKTPNEAIVSALTFNQLINLFIENRTTIIKETTMYDYKNKRPHLNTIANVKLKDFNIKIYEYIYKKIYKQL